MNSEYLVEVKDLKQYFPIKVGFTKKNSAEGGGWSIFFHQTRRNAWAGGGVRMWEDDGWAFPAASVYPYIR